MDPNDTHAKNAALHEVERHLAAQDGLSRVPALRAEYLHKRSAVERQMRLLQSARLDQASVGYILGRNCSLWSQLCRRYDEVDRLMTQSHLCLALQSDSLQRITLAVRNVRRTLKLVDIFASVPLEIELLVDDVKDGDVDLLSVHARLLALERIRHIAVLDAWQTPEYVEQFDVVFDKLASIRASLDRKIMGPIRRALTLSQYDSRVVVNTVRVVEREEAEDRWWDEYLECYHQDIPGCPGHVQAAVSPSPKLLRKPGRYAARVEQEIKDSVQDRFDDTFGPVRAARQNKATSYDEFVVHVTDTARMIVEDHDIVLKFIAPCFPPRYDIASLYACEYHNHLMKIITEAIDPSGGAVLSPSSVVRIVNWYSDYRERVTSLDWGSVSGKTTPGGKYMPDFSLSDFNREILARYYQINFSEVLNQLVLLVVRADAKKDAQGRYQSLRFESGRGHRETKAPEELFDLVRTQIKEASRVSSGEVLISLVEASLEAFQLFKSEVLKPVLSCRMPPFVDGLVPPSVRLGSPSSPLSRNDSAHSHFSTTRTLRDPPLEYIVALVNNATRCVEYAQEYKSMLFDVLEEAYHERLDVVDHAVDIFVDMEKIALDSVVAYVLEEAFPIADKFFAGKFSNEVMLDVVDLLREIFRDLKIWLVDYHFREVAVYIMKWIVESYINCFVRGRAFSLNVSVLLASLDADIDAIHSFFSEHLKPRYSDRILAPMIALRELFLCPLKAEDLAVAYARMVELWPRFKLSVVESVCNSRASPISVSELNSILQQCAAAQNVLAQDLCNVSTPDELPQQPTMTPETGRMNCEVSDSIHGMGPTSSAVSRKILRWRPSPAIA
mmetsp:Transcript_15992/g.32118  ORF Transcript_15992/g.32118 Transcript_15992/m.32118 type:complete len:840 (-) Transcript_15992:1718-4237(-)